MTSKKKTSGIANITHPKTRELLQAVRAKATGQVRQLVRREKVKVNVVDDDDPRHPTPLLIAAQNQSLDIVRALIRAKPPADVNAEDMYGKKPIWYAAKHADGELARILCSDSNQEIETNYLDRESGCSPLYRAILSNSAEVAREILHAGADVNLRRLGVETGDDSEASTGETPLIKCVQLNNIEIVDMLINSLCDIHAKTTDGFTALHYSVSYRRYEIVDLLLHNRIKIHARSNNGATAMTIAIAGHLAAMCKLLVEYGYDIDRPFSWKETPLRMAVRCHAETCAMTLVHYGCNIQDKSDSYFFHAASEGLLSLVRLLLDVYPYFIYEEWVRERRIPLALYKNPEFCDWLFSLRKDPRTLVQITKSKIFKCLGKFACIKIEKLSIPKTMIDFLKYNHHFHEKMYHQLTLDEDECPYDCPPLCNKRNCPPLDFSDSASDDYR